MTNLEISPQKQAWLDNIIPLSSRKVGDKKFTPHLITNAFDVFAKGRAAYQEALKKMQVPWPSVKTLQRITSRVSKLTEFRFFKSFFSNAKADEKIVVLMHDEIYVKKSLCYHGGHVFGKAANSTATDKNDAKYYAKTCLGIMFRSLKSDLSCLSKILPICGLTSNFLNQSISDTCHALKDNGVTVKAIIQDGNRVNQRFFKEIETIPEKPWQTADSTTFLLFDYVHLYKCLRNNWVTDKAKELVYYVYENGTKIPKRAKWAHLIQLFELELEDNHMFTMSALTAVSVRPKPIEKQRVEHVLKIFNEQKH